MASPRPASPFVSTQVSTTPALAVMFANDELHRLNFSLKIAQKLDEKNFCLWRQQVEPYINAHNLADFIDCTRIPPQFIDDTTRNSGFVNPEYSVWLQKDQIVIIMASIYAFQRKSFSRTRVFACSQTLGPFIQLFSKTNSHKSAYLRVDFHAITLDILSSQDYLLKIRTIVDAASIDDPLPSSSSYHIDVMLEGLSSDYAPVFSVI